MTRRDRIVHDLRRRTDTVVWNVIERAARVVARRERGSARWARRCVRRLTKAEERLAAAVAADPAHLHRFERAVHSQNGEDGIVAEIFRRIGVGDRQVVEIGAADGVENCSAALVDAGWTALWVEGDPAKVERARRDRPQASLTVRQSFVDAETIVPLLRDSGAPAAPDLLIIDIDGNDYWVWRAIAAAFRPLVVVIEYNAAVGPHLHWVMPYSAAHRWDQTRYHSAGLAALAALGEELGYTLVGCESSGTNAFFVQRRYAPLFTPGSVREHFVPQRFQLPDGHPRWTPSPLPGRALSAEEASRISIRSLPLTVRAVRPGGLVYAAVAVTNGTASRIGSFDDATINLAAWWSEAQQPSEPQSAAQQSAAQRPEGVEPERCVQDWSAGPGETVHVIGRARAPEQPGAYELHLGLVQEGVRWFTGAVSAAGQVAVRPGVGAPAGAER